MNKATFPPKVIRPFGPRNDFLRNWTVPSAHCCQYCIVVHSPRHQGSVYWWNRQLTGQCTSKKGKCLGRCFATSHWTKRQRVKEGPPRHATACSSITMPAGEEDRLCEEVMSPPINSPLRLRFRRVVVYQGMGWGWGWYKDGSADRGSLTEWLIIWLGGGGGGGDYE